MPNKAHAFVTELVKRFGKPTTPIRIQREKSKGEHQ
jgi:hypothetical protein